MRYTGARLLSIITRFSGRLAALSLLLHVFCQLAAAASFSGRVTYTGNRGPVSASRPLCLCLYSDPDLQFSFGCYIFGNNAATYQVDTGGVNAYYLIAFLDLQRNDRHDGNEPYEIYRDRAATPGDAAHGGDTNVDFTFGDENLVPSPTPTMIPSPSPPPTSTPTPSCVGDCDGSGTVTIDEIIRMVNIALQRVPLDDCTVGDEDGSQSIEINEIIRAAVNAVTSCNGSA